MVCNDLAKRLGTVDVFWLGGLGGLGSLGALDCLGLSGAIFFKPLLIALFPAATASPLTDVSACATAGSLSAFLPALKILGIMGFRNRNSEAKIPPTPFPLCKY